MQFRSATIVLILFCCTTQPLSAQTPGASSKPELLFNGKNYANWQKFSGDKKVDVQQLIKMDPFDKYIILKGTAPGYLVTEQAYGNYELSLEWRWYIDRENVLEKPGPVPDRKSGVLFHVQGEADLIWPKSIKAQLKLGRAGDLQLMKDFKLSVNPERKDPTNPNNFLRGHDGVERPLGEWNTCVITCHGKFVSVSINDVKVITARDSEFTKGRIALQSETGEIHFRNITMKKLEGKPVDPDKED